MNPNQTLAVVVLVLVTAAEELIRAAPRCPQPKQPKLPPPPCDIPWDQRALGRALGSRKRMARATRSKLLPSVHAPSPPSYLARDPDPMGTGPPSKSYR